MASCLGLFKRIYLPDFLFSFYIIVLTLILTLNLSLSLSRNLLRLTLLLMTDQYSRYVPRSPLRIGTLFIISATLGVCSLGCCDGPASVPSFSSATVSWVVASGLLRQRNKGVKISFFVNLYWLAIPDIWALPSSWMKVDDFWELMMDCGLRKCQAISFRQRTRPSVVLNHSIYIPLQLTLHVIYVDYHQSLVSVSSVIVGQGWPNIWCHAMLPRTSVWISDLEHIKFEWITNCATMLSAGLCCMVGIPQCWETYQRLL